MKKKSAFSSIYTAPWVTNNIVKRASTPSTKKNILDNNKNMLSYGDFLLFCCFARPFAFALLTATREIPKEHRVVKLFLVGRLDASLYCFVPSRHRYSPYNSHPSSKPPPPLSLI
jgi:hypothetical protein